MAFLGFESSYFCPIVNIATYTSVNIATYERNVYERNIVYVPAIYYSCKVVTEIRFQCYIFYFGYMLSRVLWARLSHDSN